MRLTALAPGKVNLCLLLGGRRDDGRHELVTLLESVSLADELRLVERPAPGSDEVFCHGVEGPNLVATALERLRAGGWGGPPVSVEIDKRVPIAAGLGGGSADAAAMLRLAASLHPAPEELLRVTATELGSDVPSQLQPGAAIGTGAGDEVRTLEPLATHAFVIVPSEHALSTAEVYAEADRLGEGRTAYELRALGEQLSQALERDRRPPDELIVNDLQTAAISLCPSISEALDAVGAAGADHALVSGSGPTVFGVFWGEEAQTRAEAAKEPLARCFKGASSAVPVAPGFGHPQLSAQSVEDR